jgi:hypothetical protein
MQNLSGRFIVQEQSAMRQVTGDPPPDPLGREVRLPGSAAPTAYNQSHQWRGTAQYAPMAGASTAKFASTRGTLRCELRVRALVPRFRSS